MARDRELTITVRSIWFHLIVLDLIEDTLPSLKGKALSLKLPDETLIPLIFSGKISSLPTNESDTAIHRYGLRTCDRALRSLQSVQAQKENSPRLEYVDREPWVKGLVRNLLETKAARETAPDEVLFILNVIDSNDNHVGRLTPYYCDAWVYFEPPDSGTIFGSTTQSPIRGYMKAGRWRFAVEGRYKTNSYFRPETMTGRIVIPNSTSATIFVK